MTRQKPFPFAVSLAVLLLVFPGCETPEQKKAKEKAAMQRVLDRVAELDDAFSPSPHIGRNLEKAKEEFTKMATVIDQFNAISLSRCPEGFRDGMLEIKEAMTGLKAMLQKMLRAVEKIEAAKDLAEKNRIQNENSDYFQTAGAEQLAKMNSGSKKVSEACRQYELEPPAKAVSALQLDVKPRSSTLDSSRSTPRTTITTPAPVKPDPEMVKYMQPVYDGLQKRMKTLIRRGNDDKTSTAMRKEIAEKIREYIGNYLESTFPADFRNTLRLLDQELSHYIKTLEQQAKSEDSFFQNRSDTIALQERTILSTMENHWQTLNRISERHGCEVGSIK